MIIACEDMVEGELIIPKLYSMRLMGDDGQDIGRDSRTILTPDTLEKFSFSFQTSMETEDPNSTVAMSPANAGVTPEVQNTDLPRPGASVFEKQNLFIVHKEAGVGAWFGSGDNFGISFKNWNRDLGNEFRLQIIGLMENSDSLSQNLFGATAEYRSIKRLPNFAENLIEGGSFYPYGALGFGLGFTSSGDTMSWLYGVEATAGISFFYKNFEVSLDVLGFGYAGESTEGSGSTSGFGRTNPTLGICYYWK